MRCQMKMKKSNIPCFELEKLQECSRILDLGTRANRAGTFGIRFMVGMCAL